MRKTIVLLVVMLLTIIFPLKINAESYQVDPLSYEVSGPSATDVKDMYKFGGSVAGVIQIVGTIVSAGALIIIGIRYVVASAEEKAEYKERMLPYIIGAVLLFGASNIVNITYNAFKHEETPIAERIKTVDLGPIDDETLEEWIEYTQKAILQNKDGLDITHLTRLNKELEKRENDD